MVTFDLIALLEIAGIWCAFWYLYLSTGILYERYVEKKHIPNALPNFIAAPILPFMYAVVYLFAMANGGWE